MDLFAYTQIENLEEIAKENGIECPRLRGYRLMSEESIINISSEDKKEIAIDCVKNLCCSEPFWNSHSTVWTGDIYTDYLRYYFLKYEKNENGCEYPIKVRWDRIHGWKRKVLKTMIHNEYMKRIKNFKVWNKYVGRNDILYIHARIGGNNWPYYKDQVIDKPWFIEKVDDPFDCTYCDIYAKIKPIEKED